MKIKIAILVLVSVGIALLGYIAITVSRDRATTVWLTPETSDTPHPKSTAAKPVPQITPAEIVSQPAPKKESSDTPNPEPKYVTRTFSLLPAQAVNFKNQIFWRLEIHSEYPIRVLTGQCRRDYAVEIICMGQPADIFITDMRQRPIFSTPKGNLITITGSTSPVYFGDSNAASDNSAQPAENDADARVPDGSRIYELLPGRSVSIDDARSDHLHFHSSGPISIYGSGCQFQFVTDVDCPYVTSNLIVTDLRSASESGYNFIKVDTR